MRQLQGAWIEGANDPQWLPHDDTLGVFPANLRFESICDEGVAQSLNAFWERSREDDIERKVIVAGWQGLQLVLTSIFK